MLGRYKARICHLILDVSLRQMFSDFVGVRVSGVLPCWAIVVLM